MPDTTIIYVTSNREKLEFEEKIQKALLQSAEGLPIISVSQKPIKFGQNICVGNIGAKPENVLKQLIVGATAAETKFVAVGESDFLYPREFFRFVPPSDDTFYYPDNVYIIWTHHNRFFKKNLREMLSVTNCDHFVCVLEKVLSGLGDDHIVSRVKQFTKQDWFHTDIPLVTFKTRDGMHWRSPFNKNGSKKSLPQWGSAKELIKRFCE